jgi:hypothetical protein
MLKRRTAIAKLLNHRDSIHLTTIAFAPLAGIAYILPMSFTNGTADAIDR